MSVSSGVEVFLLGAGRPARGSTPSALKKIALNTRVMDWQIHSVADIAAPGHVHYLGGYHADEVMARYPQLHFTILPEWEKGSILESLLAAPFSGKPVVVAYSDTLFRRQQVNALTHHTADIVLAVDSRYATRFEGRSADDLAKAELITTQSGQKAEFTGLVYFSAKAVAEILRLRDSMSGSRLLDAIATLEQSGLSTEQADVYGEWAELNSPVDVARFVLGTKAQTLARLKPLLTKSVVSDLTTLSQQEWERDRAAALTRIQTRFPDQPLVVRSSASAEDGWSFSHAGGFESVLNVPSQSEEALGTAIQRVFDSYGDKGTPQDHLLIQPMLQNVAMAGVVFTCTLETGAPYYRLNMDESGTSTASVTAGEGGAMRTFLVHRPHANALAKQHEKMQRVLDAIIEIETLLGYDKLDIECALDTAGQVHLFQVRPVAVDHSAYELTASAVHESLTADRARFDALQAPPPQIAGDFTLFGNMPDWNPAEIIGTRPRPLAMSLYQYVIVNHIWAQQRAEYGYRDLRPHPLIVSFSGQPYVDIRASLNSFIPAELPDDLARRMVNAWQQRLAAHPHLHDKIEFDIAFTVWTPDMAQQAEERLCPHGIRKDEIAAIEAAYRRLTRNALIRLEADTAPVDALFDRIDALNASDLPPLHKAYQLLYDLRHYGTLPFAHAARAGFVAATLLRSMVRQGVFSEERRLAFLRSIPTVASQFEADKYACASGDIPLAELTARHGHLRPGTYDITVEAYWEAPEQYFALNRSHAPAATPDFHLSDAESRALAEMLAPLELPLSPAEVMTFCHKAIQAREGVKHRFTRGLSLALDNIVLAGNAHGFSREELAFLTWEDIQAWRLGRMSQHALRQSIALRREEYRITELVELPSLIRKAENMVCFERMASQPNFITRQRVEADIACITSTAANDLADKIIVIPQADPGYDWLFGHRIAGLITQYGGANSHMAIRSAEIGLPAAIGVGDQLYERILTMQRAMLDCAGQTIRKLA